MSEWNERLRKEVDELRGLRDDLKVRVHLAKMDAQDRFQKAERSWEQLETKLRQLGDASKESAEDVSQAARLLVDEIREGYRHVRDKL